MVKEVRALHSRTETHTFLSNGEDEWIDGGILGALLQAKEKTSLRAQAPAKKHRLRQEQEKFYGQKNSW